VDCVHYWMAFPHPSPLCKPQGQGKYSYLVAHGHMAVITVGWVGTAYKIVPGENLKIRNHMWDLIGDEKIILKLTFMKHSGRVWDKLIWLRIESGHKIVWMWKWPSCFIKCRFSNFMGSERRIEPKEFFHGICILGTSI
jgi:hypothetical protein